MVPASIRRLAGFGLMLSGLLVLGCDEREPAAGAGGAAAGSTDVAAQGPASPADDPVLEEVDRVADEVALSSRQNAAQILQDAEEAGEGGFDPDDQADGLSEQDNAVQDTAAQPDNAGPTRP